MSSAAVAERPAQAVTPVERVISYVPLGAKQSIDLTINMVRRFLCTPTRSGNVPSDQDIIKFMMLCKARELDPWVGDAYLTGYDTQDGPQFSLITAVQALYKRAEISPDYDGIESGVVVKKPDGTLEDRAGDFFGDDEILVGGWARCYRRDQKIPSFDRLKLTTFDTQKSRWKKDPGGMIAKCAEASVLRKAFPTQLGGLYTREEMEHLAERRIENRDAERIGPARATSGLSELAARMEEKPVERELRLEADKMAAAALQSQAEEKPAESEADKPEPEWRRKYEAMAAECETPEQCDKGMDVVDNDGSLSDGEKSEAHVLFGIRKKALAKKK
jgi:phage recombination protein Bet